MHPYRRVPALPPRLLLCLSCAQKQCDTLARWLQQVRLVFFINTENQFIFNNVVHGTTKFVTDKLIVSNIIS